MKGLPLAGEFHSNSSASFGKKFWQRIFMEFVSADPLGNGSTLWSTSPLSGLSSTSSGCSSSACGSLFSSLSVFSWTAQRADGSSAARVVCGCGIGRLFCTARVCGCLGGRFGQRLLGSLISFHGLQFLRDFEASAHLASLQGLDPTLGI